ncbi:MAG: 1-acyl-sn-glycerol-3-phosphate acyltransferase [Acidobacteriota bacterium]|nr:1-acyl-sn-glycerol-3-phosphate acyltransferase [Acidobacteriota bacterium]
MQTLRAYLIIAPLVILLTAAMGTTSLLASLLRVRENRLHEIAQFWARLLLRFSSIHTELEGLDRLDPKESYVIVANHASYMDTPVLMATLPLQFRFLAKAELFRIPFIGTHLGRAGHFPVERGNVRASLKSMSEAARAIRERHVSVLIFPEGGRSEDKLREFKEGAAYIAIKSGVPIVAIALVGTRAVLPMHSKRVRPGLVRVLISRPIETAGMTLNDRNWLSDQLYREVAEMTGEKLDSNAAGTVA